MNDGDGSMAADGRSGSWQAQGWPPPVQFVGTRVKRRGRLQRFGAGVVLVLGAAAAAALTFHNLSQPQRSLGLRAYQLPTGAIVVASPRTDSGLVNYTVVTVGKRRVLGRGRVRASSTSAAVPLPATSCLVPVVFRFKTEDAQRLLWTRLPANGGPRAKCLLGHRRGIRARSAHSPRVAPSTRAAA